MRWRIAAIGLLAVTAPAAGWAQGSTDRTAIAACLCLQQAVATLSADMSAKTQALDAVRRELANLDAQLAAAYPKVEVNNPDSVGRYKALLEHRDQIYRQSVGPVVGDADQAVGRYNAHVNQYNAQCANHPFDSQVMAQVQATLSCPPIQ